MHVLVLYLVYLYFLSNWVVNTFRRPVNFIFQILFSFKYWDMPLWAIKVLWDYGPSDWIYMADVCGLETGRNSSNPHKYDFSIFTLWWLDVSSQSDYNDFFFFFHSDCLYMSLFSLSWLNKHANGIFDCFFSYSVKCRCHWYVRKAWSGSWYKHMESEEIQYFREFCFTLY